MSVHVFVRARLADGSWDISDGRRSVRLSARIETDLPALTFKIQTSGAAGTVTFDAQLTGDQITTLAATIATAKTDIADGLLAALKGLRYTKADVRTVAVLAAGFAHGGTTYSLSHVEMLDIHRSGLAYPLAIDSLDGATTTSMANEAAFDALFAAGDTFCAAADVAATAFKASLRAAVDVAALDAIVDVR